MKMLKMGATDEHRLKLLQEAAIMGQFVHKNVVRLHGVVTVGEPVSVIAQYICTACVTVFTGSLAVLPCCLCPCRDCM